MVPNAISKVIILITKLASVAGLCGNRHEAVCQATLPIVYKGVSMAPPPDMLDIDPECACQLPPRAGMAACMLDTWSTQGAGAAHPGDDVGDLHHGVGVSNGVLNRARNPAMMLVILIMVSALAAVS